MDGDDPIGECRVAAGTATADLVELGFLCCNRSTGTLLTWSIRIDCNCPWNLCRWRQPDRERREGWATKGGDCLSLGNSRRPYRFCAVGLDHPYEPCLCVRAHFMDNYACGYFSVVWTLGGWFQCGFF